MESTTEKTEMVNGTGHPRSSTDWGSAPQASSIRLGIEAWAEWERHWAESDAQIAAFLGPHIKTGWIAKMREENPLYWRHLENRAKAEGPRLTRDRAAREYLTPSEYLRPSRQPRSLLEWVSADWLGWLLILVIGAALIAGTVFPELREMIKGLLQ